MIKSILEKGTQAAFFFTCFKELQRESGIIGRIIYLAQCHYHLLYNILHESFKFSLK